MEPSNLQEIAVEGGASPLLSIHDSTIFSSIEEANLEQNSKNKLYSIIRKNLITSSSNDGLYTAVKNCTRCKHFVPDPQLSIGNITDPRLLIITESAAIEPKKKIIELFQELGLPKNVTAVTSLVRCSNSIDKVESFS